MLVDISVPELGIDSLTYEADTELQAGTRVIVEVVRTKHTGFVLGQSKAKLPPHVKVKHIEGVIDDSHVISPDVWDLAVW